MGRPHYIWTLRNMQIELGRRTAVMGILNVTPDSFSDGGDYFDRHAAVGRALEIESEGADILDIGGESSRPGSAPVEADEELRRVLPVLEALAGKLRIPISIDTYRSEVARRSLEAGAQIVNDISGFRFDHKMPGVVREYRAGAVLMHSRGERDTLHLQPPMTAPLKEVGEGLLQSINLAVEMGIPRAAIVIDPGIGFGKRAEESLHVLNNIGAFAPLKCPLLVGPSRKSFLKKIAPDRPEARLWETAGAVAIAVAQGTHIVRVHDVRPMRTLVDTLDTIMESGRSNV